MLPLPVWTWPAIVRLWPPTLAVTTRTSPPSATAWLRVVGWFQSVQKMPPAPADRLTVVVLAGAADWIGRASAPMPPAPVAVNTYEPATSVRLGAEPPLTRPCCEVVREVEPG